MKDKIVQILFHREGLGLCNFSICNDQYNIANFNVPNIPVEEITPSVKKLLVEAYRLGLKRGANLAIEEMARKVNINQISSNVCGKVETYDYTRFE